MITEAQHTVYRRRAEKRRERRLALRQRSPREVASVLMQKVEDVVDEVVAPGFERCLKRREVGQPRRVLDHHLAVDQRRLGR
ncbi:hypothetical protein RHODOP_01024 [Rhodoplanes sp. P11]